MNDKHFSMCLLFDFYGDILTEKQHELFDLYYNEDLSLAEIAEHASITRQGVRDGIVRAERTLLQMEDKLKFVERFQRIQTGIQELADDIFKINKINQERYQNLEIERLLTDIHQKISLLTE